jgi:hypothetical protein
MSGRKQHNNFYMYSWQHLNNLGIIMDKLPNDLFQNLKNECELAKQARYNSTIQKKEMISGLSGNGIPAHYYIEDCKQELDQYVMQKFYEYENEFKYLSQFKFIDRDMGLNNTESWVNVQEKYEYIPAHNHDGIIAYVIWVQIPYDIKNELKSGQTSSCFEFQYSSILGAPMNKIIEVSKEHEGYIMMFPSGLIHQVYPFYTSDDVRMSVSGMVSFDGGNPRQKKDLASYGN